MKTVACALLLGACSLPNPGFYVDSDDPPEPVPTSGETGATADSGDASGVTDTIPCDGRDEDGDGVCDAVDVCPGGDDSLDNDGDGAPNLCDVCVDDPDDDLDGDGVCGELDVCPGGADELDEDNDGQPDACDACPQDPGDDGDGDGVCDGLDLCPGADDKIDSNANGTPDGCDPCPDDGLGDSDGDGVCDSQDKCPGADDKLESDGDGVPDACDKCPNDPGNDLDGDTICDDVDNCNLANPDQADGDNDGHGDPCDVCKHPNFADDDADYDGDGIPCAQDPCLFDGPDPTSFPGSVGPLQEITISKAKLDGGGNFAIVAPNAQVALSYTWAAHFCQCDDCVTQGMVGLAGYPPSQCFHSPPNNKSNCKNIGGNTTQLFKAPAQPGTYFFRFRRTWEYSCIKDATLEDPLTEFAAICVK